MRWFWEGFAFGVATAVLAGLIGWVLWLMVPSPGLFAVAWRWMQ